MLKFLLRRFSKINQKLNAASNINPSTIKQGLKELEKNKPHLDKLYYYDPDIMGSLPWFLDFLDKPVEIYKDLFMYLQQYTNLSWVTFLFSATAVVRLAMLPLMVYQMKNMGSLAPIMPSILFVSKNFREIPLPTYKKIYYIFRGTISILHSNKIRIYKVFIFNISYICFMVFSILSLRRVVCQQNVRGIQFLWLDGMANIDPYWITSVGAVALIYYNLGRGITQENKNNFICRLKSIGQVLVILWLPIVCYWPAGVTIFIFFSSILSVFQTSLMTSQWFRQKTLSKETIAYFKFLVSFQLDNKQAEVFVKAIMTGDERFKQVSQQQLMRNTKQIVNRLNQIQQQDNQKKNINQQNSKH